MHKEIGIDLGSTHMLVSTAEEGIIACEPSVVAVHRETGNLHSIGHAAIEHAKDQTANLRLIRPLREGIIKDSTTTCTMLAHVIHMTCGNLIIKPRVLIGIPFDMKEEHETLLEWTAAHAGARETFLVYTPVAAMVGLGITPENAIMLADIGASRTSIMLTGGGKILYKNTIPVGGDAFDNAISSYLLTHYYMKINSQSAESIKNKIGTVWLNREDRKLNVKGRNAETGEPVTAHLSTKEMFDALEEPTARLIAAVCEAISHIPSAYVGEIFHRGILLCGGAATLDGLDKMISGVTGVNARVVDKPSEVVALGLAKILADLPTSMKNAKINISGRCMRADF